MAQGWSGGSRSRQTAECNFAAVPEGLTVAQGTVMSGYPKDRTAVAIPAAVRGLAILAGFEAAVRGTLLSVFPLAMYRALGDAQLVSSFYFTVGLISLASGLSVPVLTRYLPRRWVYTLGAGLYLLTALCGMIGGPMTVVALLTNALATGTVFVCFNGYVMDTVAKPDLSKLETLRLFYGGIGWGLGPVTGVWVMGWWPGAPFAISGIAAAVMLAMFWYLRLGSNKVISRAKRASPNPLRYLRRFFAQPRLVAGWFFTVMRSVGWWVFIVYVSIFAVEKGLGDRVGGIATSIAQLSLFASPVMLRWIQARSVRRAVRTGFLCAAIAFTMGTVLAPWPWLTIAALMCGTACLVLLDICGGLPFLMSVKPSERNEMSAVYSSFRDVSGIVTPGVAWAVLHVAPVEAVFATCGAGMLLAWAVAGFLHPDLGVPGRERVRG